MSDTLTAEQKIKKSRVLLLRQCGFFGTLALRLIIKRKDEIETCATDCKHYFYNEEFVRKLSIEELVFVTLHEILHCALLHPFRRSNRDQYIWNLAVDISINEMIIEMQEKKVLNDIITIPNWIVKDKQFRGKTPEYIYEQLLKDAEKNALTPQELSGLLNGNISKELEKKLKRCKYGNIFINGTFDNHNIDNQDLTDADEKTSREWKEYLSAAKYSDSQKIVGKLPSNIRRYIDEILYPKQNWKNILRDFLTIDTKDYKFEQPDERFYSFDFIIPGYVDDEAKNLKKAYVLQDVSGSITKEMHNSFSSEVNGILNEFNVTGEYITWDVGIQNVFDFETLDIQTAEITGLGGSDVTPVFEYIEEKGEEYSVIICFTDGFISYPRDKKYDKVIWVITDDNSPLENVEFGMKLHYEV